MSRVDPRFERLARQLTWLELRRPDEDDELEGIGLSLSPRGRAFVDTYSVAGLRTVIEHYGLHAKLEERGLGDYDLVVAEEDSFHHKLELVLRGDVPEGADRHVMDLRLHLGRLARSRDKGDKGDKGDNGGNGDGRDDSAQTNGSGDEAFDVVVIEWLLMQNPRGSFTKERPRLPGQRHPGTGLGKDVAQLLVLMCRRISRAGLVVVPERYHLAELYARSGWLAPSPASDRLIDEVKLADPTLSFAARAWAMERGCVFDEDGAPVMYVAEERVLPVAEELEKHLKPGGSWLRSLFETRRKLRVDVARLAQSLRDEPVEGMDPDALGG